jgi:hypothetical protein
MANIDAERDAAQHAERAIVNLKKSRAASAQIIETLRIASRIATRASAKPAFSSEPLKAARAEIPLALGDLVNALAANDLNDQKIDRALRAVQDWKNGLIAQESAN